MLCPCPIWDEAHQDCLLRLALVKILHLEEKERELSATLGTKQKILKLMAQGYSNNKIAEALSLSPKTIKNYVTDIMRILNAENRTQAVIIALRRGLVSLEKEQ